MIPCYCGVVRAFAESPILHALVDRAPDSEFIGLWFINFSTEQPFGNKFFMTAHN